MLSWCYRSILIPAPIWCRSHCSSDSVWLAGKQASEAKPVARYKPLYSDGYVYTDNRTEYGPGVRCESVIAGRVKLCGYQPWSLPAVARMNWASWGAIHCLVSDVAGAPGSGADEVHTVGLGIAGSKYNITI